MVKYLLVAVAAVVLLGGYAEPNEQQQMQLDYEQLALPPDLPEELPPVASAPVDPSWPLWLQFIAVVFPGVGSILVAYFGYRAVVHRKRD